MLRLIACIILPCFFLAACSKKGPSSPTLERKALMQIVYPGWSATDKGRLQTLHIANVPDPKAPKTDVPPVTERKELIDPVFVVRLADDQAVLITQNFMTNDDGGQAFCHSCSAGFGAFQFERDGDRWLLTKRDDEFFGAGLTEEASADVIKLARNRYALKISNGGTWSGYTIDSMDLIELTPSGAKQLNDQAINISGNSDDATAGCSEDTPEERKQIAASLKETVDADFPAFGNCYHVDGKWKFDATGDAPGDLKLSFEGVIRNKEEYKSNEIKHINSTQVFHYQAGKYVVVSGTNPVPTP